MAKLSVYFPEETAAELAAEAKRLDMSTASLIQRAWSIARERMARLPAGPALQPGEVRPPRPWERDPDR